MSFHDMRQKWLFHQWQRNNPYYRKRFSILGDSISTLEGFQPNSYSIFYRDANCDRAGVHTKEATWWWKLITFYGAKLLINNSWSGSRVTKFPESKRIFPAGCSDERTNGLHYDTLIPEVIVIYLGTNDWAYGVPVHFDPDRAKEESFDCACQIMLDKLRRNYPSAELWCCTLSTTFVSKNPAFQFPHEYAGIHMEHFNAVIRENAAKEHCRLVDLYALHRPYDSIDGSHPNAAGMRTLAENMIQATADKKGQSFLSMIG